jgi:hypothetical protein
MSCWFRGTRFISGAPIRTVHAWRTVRTLLGIPAFIYSEFFLLLPFYSINLFCTMASYGCMTTAQVANVSSQFIRERCCRSKLSISITVVFTAREQHVSGIMRAIEWESRHRALPGEKRVQAKRTGWSISSSTILHPLYLSNVLELSKCLLYMMYPYWWPIS